MQFAIKIKRPDNDRLKANMAAVRPPQPIMAFFLLIIFGANFLLLTLWPQANVFLPHDHLILGPIYPGWEDHHEVLHSSKCHSHSEPARSGENRQTISVERDTGMRSKVISLYRLPAGEDSILSFGVQVLWLSEWPILPEFSPLTWPLDPVSLSLSSVFLPLLDKPPSLFLR